MVNVWIAYGLWLVGGFGCLGFHRFYLGKIPTGVLWLFTGGLGFLGSLYDFFTLGRQVAEVNARNVVSSRPVQVTIQRQKEPLDRSILRLAERNSGRVTPAQVAASSDWSIDEAQARLDAMARKSVCELRVLKGGTVVYHFAEFDPSASQEFEV